MRARSIGLFAAAIVLIAASAFAQEASIFGTVADSTSGALPGVTVTATSLTNGRVFSSVSDERGEYRLRGLAPDRYKVQAELSGFATIIVPDVEVLVGQNRVGAVRDASGDAQRNAHGHRRSAARRHQLHAGRRQRRSPPDGGTAAAGPQLDGAGDAGQGHHRQRRRQQPRRPRPRVPAEPRRPGDHPAGGRRRLRPAALQPRGHRRIPGHHQPVRHHPGPFARHPGAGDLALGHQQPRRQLSTASSATTSSTPRTSSPTAYCRIRTSRSAPPSAGRSCATSSTISCPTNARTSPTPSSPRRRRSVAPAFRSIASWYRTASSAAPTGSCARATTSRRAGRTGTGAIRSRQVSGTEHPSQAADRSRKAFNVSNTWANVISDSTIQEVRVSYSHFEWKNLLAESALDNTPNYVFPGLTVGQRRNYPQEFFQNTWTARYDLTSSIGAHDVKFGAEFLRWHDTGSMAAAVARRVHLPHRSRPISARRFPADAWNDPITVGPQRPRRPRPALRPELRRLDHRHPAAEPRRVGGRHLEDQQRPHRERRRALGRRLRRSRPAAHHHPGDLRPAPRRGLSRAANPAGWPAPAIRAACATSTTSPRAAASPGTSAGAAIWSCAAAAASTSASPTRTRPSATSRSTASASW